MATRTIRAGVPAAVSAGSTTTAATVTLRMGGDQPDHDRRAQIQTACATSVFHAGAIVT